MMGHDGAKREVHENYEVFKELLPELMLRIPGKFVVLHRRKIAKSFDTFPDAVQFGYRTFGRGHFSVQEVTDRVITLGAWSHALHPDPN
jgi:hypothetical protein